MTINGWLQIAFYFVVLTAFVVPLGRYMARVFEGERTFMSPVLRPVEAALYRIGWIQILLYCAIIVAITPVLGAT